MGSVAITKPLESTATLPTVVNSCPSGDTVVTVYGVAWAGSRLAGTRQAKKETLTIPTADAPVIVFPHPGIWKLCSM
jgi:hypothetical protein